jgi:hypothetical protein
MMVFWKTHFGFSWQNYTAKGYAHVKAPEGAFAPLLKFFEDHKDRAEEESW